MFKSEDVYDDIYYTSNFIGAIGFDDFDGAISPATLPELTGRWDLGYRYETDWGPDFIQYITLTDTGNPASFYPTVASGLDPAAEVFQLELVNLITGEDFETGSGTWGGSGTFARITSTVFFGGHYMRLDADSGENLAFTTTATVPFYTTKTYNVFFRYTSTGGQVALDIDGFKQTLNKTTLGEKGYARYSLTPNIAIAPIFIFSPTEAGASLSNVWVDNFRVGRYGNMVLRLKLTSAQTIPRLEQGTYSFSVWTRPVDPTFESIPYNIDSFVIKMAAAEGTGTLSTTSATYSYTTTTGWQKYTATLQPGALTFDEDTIAPVLTLVLDFNQTRPGVVLLAQPELRFHPDGL